MGSACSNQVQPEPDAPAPPAHTHTHTPTPTRDTASQEPALAVTTTGTTPTGPPRPSPPTSTPNTATQTKPAPAHNHSGSTPANAVPPKPQQPQQAGGGTHPTPTGTKVAAAAAPVTKNSPPAQKPTQPTQPTQQSQQLSKQTPTLTQAKTQTQPQTQSQSQAQTPPQPPPAALKAAPQSTPTSASSPVAAKATDTAAAAPVKPTPAVATAAVTSTSVTPANSAPAAKPTSASAPSATATAAASVSPTGKSNAPAAKAPTPQQLQPQSQPQPQPPPTAVTTTSSATPAITTPAPATAPKPTPAPAPPAAAAAAAAAATSPTGKSNAPTAAATNSAAPTATSAPLVAAATDSPKRAEAKKVVAPSPAAVAKAEDFLTLVSTAATVAAAAATAEAAATLAAHQAEDATLPHHDLALICASDTIDLCRAIVNDLQSEFNYWCYCPSMNSSSSSEKAICEAEIEKSNFILTMISPSFFENPTCIKQLVHAEQKGKKITLVLYQGTIVPSLTNLPASSPLTMLTPSLLSQLQSPDKILKYSRNYHSSFLRDQMFPFIGKPTPNRTTVELYRRSVLALIAKQLSHAEYQDAELDLQTSTRSNYTPAKFELAKLLLRESYCPSPSEAFKLLWPLVSTEGGYPGAELLLANYTPGVYQVEVEKLPVNKRKSQWDLLVQAHTRGEIEATIEMAQRYEVGVQGLAPANAAAPATTVASTVAVPASPSSWESSSAPYPPPTITPDLTLAYNLLLTAHTKTPHPLLLFHLGRMKTHGLGVPHPLVYEGVSDMISAFKTPHGSTHPPPHE